jgi:hypothetical protein
MLLDSQQILNWSTDSLVKVKVVSQHAQHALREHTDIALPILNLGVRMEWVANVMLRLLYPRERD